MSMDAFVIVKDDLDKVVRKALSLRIIQNPKISGEFFNNNTVISSKYSFFDDEEDYRANAAKKYEAGEYLFAMMDGAFLQINYEFTRRSKRRCFLSKMNLCYLPPVVGGLLLKDYIRIDFNEEDSSFFHSNAHLHVGFLNEIRIPLDDVLLFSKFFNLILYCFYPEDFKTFNDGILSISHSFNNNSTTRLTQNVVLSDELKSFLYLQILN